jgi:hypothetical protein
MMMKKLLAVSFLGAAFLMSTGTFARAEDAPPAEKKEEKKADKKGKKDKKGEEKKTEEAPK